MTTQKIAGGTVHKLPTDFRKAITSDAHRETPLGRITPLARNDWICGHIGQKEETRNRRIDVGIDKLREACAGRAVGPMHHR